MPVGPSVKSKGLGETEIPEVLKPLFNNLPEEEYKGIRDAVLNLWEEYGKNEDPNVFRWKVGLVLLRYVRDVSQYPIYEEEKVDVRNRLLRYYQDYSTISDENVLSNYYDMLYHEVADPNKLRAKDAPIIDGVDDIVPKHGLLESIPVKIQKKDSGGGLFGWFKKKPVEEQTPLYDTYPSVSSLFSSDLSYDTKVQTLSDGMWREKYNEAEISGWSLLYSKKFADMRFNFSRGVMKNNKRSYTPGRRYENLDKKYEENKVEDVKLQTGEQTYQVEIETGLPKERSKKYDLVDYLKVYQYHVMFDFVRVYGEHTLDKDKQIFKFQPYIQKVDDHYEFGVEVNPNVDVLRDKFNDFFEDPRFRRYIFGISMLGGTYLEALYYLSQKDGDPLYWSNLAVESSKKGKEGEKEFVNYMKEAKKYVPIVFLGELLNYLSTKSGGKVDKSKARLNEIQTTVIPVYENYLEGTATKDDVLDAIMNLSFVKNDNKLKQAIRKNSGDLSKLLLGLIEGVLPDKGPSITGKELNHILDPKNKNSYVYRLYTSYNVRIHASSYLNGLRVLAKLEDYLNEKNWSFSQLAYHVATAKSPDDEVIKDLANILKEFVNKNSQIKKTSEEEIRQAIYDLRAQPMFALMLIGVGGHLGLDYSKIARFDQDWSQFWKEEDIEVRDENGKPVLDENGNPVKIPMKDFISTFDQLNIEGFYVPEFEFNEEEISAIEMMFDTNVKFVGFGVVPNMFVSPTVNGNRLDLVFKTDPESGERILKNPYYVNFTLEADYDGTVRIVNPEGEVKEGHSSGVAANSFVLVTLVDDKGNVPKGYTPQIVQADENGRVRLSFDANALEDGSYYIKAIVVGHPTIPQSMITSKVQTVARVNIGRKPFIAETYSPGQPTESEKVEMNIVSPDVNQSTYANFYNYDEEGNQNVDTTQMTEELKNILLAGAFNDSSFLSNLTNLETLLANYDRENGTNVKSTFEGIITDSNLSPEEIVEKLFGCTLEELNSGSLSEDNLADPTTDLGRLQRILRSFLTTQLTTYVLSINENYSITGEFDWTNANALREGRFNLYQVKVSTKVRNFNVTLLEKTPSTTTETTNQQNLETVSYSFKLKGAGLDLKFTLGNIGYLLVLSGALNEIPYIPPSPTEDFNAWSEFVKNIGYRNIGKVSGLKSTVSIGFQPIQYGGDEKRFGMSLTNVTVGEERTLTPGGNEPIRVKGAPTTYFANTGVRVFIRPNWGLIRELYFASLGGVSGLEPQAGPLSEHLWYSFQPGINFNLGKRMWLDVGGGVTKYPNDMIIQLNTGLVWSPKGSNHAFVTQLQIGRSLETDALQVKFLFNIK